VTGISSGRVAFPRLKVWLSGREFAGAETVEPGGGAALGILLVGGLSVVIKFEEVGEESGPITVRSYFNVGIGKETVAVE
jgi:hypothetical protein